MPGPSVRLKLTFSYVAFLMLAGFLLLAVAWLFLLRDVPMSALVPSTSNFLRVFDPGNAGPVIFSPAAVLVLAFLLIFGLLGGWMLSGHMLAPLARIAQATRLAADGSLSHRIALDGRKDEFRELADVFDAMLTQLETHLAEQQRFAANASHELRTPLATMQALLDVARNDPDRDPVALIDHLHGVNSRMIDLTEALLLLSRADRRSFARDTVDLSLVAEEAVETLLPLAEKCGVAMALSGEPAVVSGSYPLLLHSITNLLRNAIVHNVTDSRSVHVDTSARGDLVILVVENTGAQLAQSQVSTFTEPFQRGVERTQADHAGVGLGLAIVKSITEAHDGTLTLTPRPEGGLRVTAQLPAAPRTPAREIRS